MTSPVSPAIRGPRHDPGRPVGHPGIADSRAGKTRRRASAREPRLRNPRVQRLVRLRTISTFSCDIARAVSRRLRSRRERLAPTGPRLRGPLRGRGSSDVTILPFTDLVDVRGTAHARVEAAASPARYCADDNPITRSPTSMYRSTSSAAVCQASSKSLTSTAACPSRPAITPLLRPSLAGPTSTSGSQQLRSGSMSPRVRTPRSPLARSPRSPATSPAQYPAGSGVAVSVLLRRPRLRRRRAARRRRCPRLVSTFAVSAAVVDPHGLQFPDLASDRLHRAPTSARHDAGRTLVFRSQVVPVGSRPALRTTSPGGVKREVLDRSGIRSPRPERSRSSGP